MKVTTSLHFDDVSDFLKHVESYMAVLKTDPFHIDIGTVLLGDFASASIVLQLSDLVAVLSQDCSIQFSTYRG